MDDASLTPMTPLDSMVSDDTLQMMKATLPYLPPRQARMLAVLAKFQELKNTLSMQPSGSDTFQAMSTSAPLDDDALLNALKTCPTLPPGRTSSVTSGLSSASHFLKKTICSSPRFTFSA